MICLCSKEYMACPYDDDFSNYDWRCDDSEYNTENDIEEVKMSKSKWIAVADRLPDKDGNYLVAHSNGRINISLFFAKTDNMPAHFVFNSADNKIIAWKSLPEPPQEVIK